MSHPTMGAWIEIAKHLYSYKVATRRTPRWVRGLKSFTTAINKYPTFVAPHDGCVD